MERRPGDGTVKHDEVGAGNRGTMKLALENGCGEVVL